MSFLIKFIICSILLHFAHTQDYQYNPLVKKSLTATYSWELILDIDNSNNNENVERKVEVTTSIFTSHSNLRETLRNTEESSDTESSLKGSIFGIVSVGLKNDVSTEIRAGYQNITEKKSESTQISRKTDIYQIGPHSKLILYRLIYNGPGVQFQTDTVSSIPHPQDEIKLDVYVKLQYFLKAIRVVYTEDEASQPDSVIETANLPNGNINKNHAWGEHVWLVPVWTTKWNEAATGIEIIIQSKSNTDYQDISKGDGGPFRYIKLLKAKSNNDRRIHEVALWRSNDDNDVLNITRWKYKTTDINKGRGGDDLFLLWNTQSVA